MSADINTNLAALDYLKTQLIRGASCQGGNSEEGRRIAGLLGIPAPLTMPFLAARAEELGFKVAELWPFYAKVLRDRAELEAVARALCVLAGKDPDAGVNIMDKNWSDHVGQALVAVQAINDFRAERPE